MDFSRLTSLPSMRRQHLLAEFAGLRQACPQGVFVSLTPGDPSLWSGVLFVRDGPYAPAILRFQISFPDHYPALPPLVTFATDIFHPLVTPLTTDAERLPPGGFSLRHGFPVWFPPDAVASAAVHRPPSSSQAAASPVQTPPRPPTSASVSVSASAGVAQSTPSHLQTRPRADAVPTYDVLRYLRSAFDDAAVLDAVPLDAAGNPGAWHAWRSHRRLQAPPGSNSSGGRADPATSTTSTTTTTTTTTTTDTAAATARDPGEWNWEHVWEERVKNGIGASVSDPVLFGSAGATDDVIHFLSMDDGDIEAIKDNLKRTLGAYV